MTMVNSVLKGLIRELMAIMACPVLPSQGPSQPAVLFIINGKPDILFSCYFNSYMYTTLSKKAGFTDASRPLGL